ncbi:MAG TPA: hypothetical protein VGA08_04165 [Candidatus Saccharimonadales bacterium]
MTTSEWSHDLPIDARANGGDEIVFELGNGNEANQDYSRTGEELVDESEAQTEIFELGETDFAASIYNQIIQPLEKELNPGSTKLSTEKRIAFFEQLVTLNDITGGQHTEKIQELVKLHYIETGRADVTPEIFELTAVALALIEPGKVTQSLFERVKRDENQCELLREANAITSDNQETVIDNLSRLAYFAKVIVVRSEELSRIHRETYPAPSRAVTDAMTLLAVVDNYRMTNQEDGPANFIGINLSSRPEVAALQRRIDDARVALISCVLRNGALAQTQVDWLEKQIDSIHDPDTKRQIDYVFASWAGPSNRRSWHTFKNISATPDQVERRQKFNDWLGLTKDQEIAKKIASLATNEPQVSFEVRAEALHNLISDLRRSDQIGSDEAVQIIAATTRAVADEYAILGTIEGVYGSLDDAASLELGRDRGIERKAGWIATKLYKLKLKTNLANEGTNQHYERLTYKALLLADSAWLDAANGEAEVSLDPYLDAVSALQDRINRLEAVLDSQVKDGLDAQDPVEPSAVTVESDSGSGLQKDLSDLIKEMTLVRMAGFKAILELGRPSLAIEQISTVEDWLSLDQIRQRDLWLWDYYVRRSGGIGLTAQNLIDRSLRVNNADLSVDEKLKILASLTANN